MITLGTALLLCGSLATFAWLGLTLWLEYRQKVYSFKAGLLPAQNNQLGGSSMVLKLVFQDIAEGLRYAWGFRLLMQYFQRRYAQLLIHAGNPALLVGDEYFLLKLVGTVLGTFCFLLVGGITSIPVLCAIGVGLYLLPDMGMQRRKRRLMQEARMALPDALETLAFMLEQGMLFRDALNLYVGKTTWMPLQGLLFPYTHDLPESPTLKPLFSTLHLRSLIKAASIVDSLEQDPITMASGLKELAMKLRKQYKRQLKRQSEQSFLRMLFCLLFFTIPSVSLILFSPIWIDYYPIITNLLTIR